MIVLSSTIIRSPRHSTSSASQRLRYTVTSASWLTGLTELTDLSALPDAHAVISRCGWSGSGAVSVPRRRAAQLPEHFVWPDCVQRGEPRMKQDGDLHVDSLGWPRPHRAGTQPGQQTL